MVCGEAERVPGEGKPLREASGPLLRAAQEEQLHEPRTDLSEAGVRFEGTLPHERLLEELLHAKQAGDRQDPQEARQEQLL